MGFSTQTAPATIYGFDKAGPYVNVNPSGIADVVHFLWRVDDRAPHYVKDQQPLNVINVPGVKIP